MPKLTEPWHVLAVKSAAKTSAYFQKQLGFEEFMAVGENDWRFLRRDDCVLMLGTCPEDLDAEETGCHSYFAYWHVEELDELYAELQKRGALVAAPADKPWGMREFLIRTPDGHRITVGKRLG